MKYCLIILNIVDTLEHMLKYEIINIYWRKPFEFNGKSVLLIIGGDESNKFTYTFILTWWFHQLKDVTTKITINCSLKYEIPVCDEMLNSNIGFRFKIIQFEKPKNTEYRAVQLVWTIYVYSKLSKMRTVWCYRYTTSLQVMNNNHNFFFF